MELSTCREGSFCFAAKHKLFLQDDRISRLKSGRGFRQGESPL
jgi:hypothetical protein